MPVPPSNYSTLRRCCCYCSSSLTLGLCKEWMSQRLLWQQSLHWIHLQQPLLIQRHKSRVSARLSTPFPTSHIPLTHLQQV